MNRRHLLDRPALDSEDSQQIESSRCFTSRSREATITQKQDNTAMETSVDKVHRNNSTESAVQRTRHSKPHWQGPVRSIKAMKGVHSLRPTPIQEHHHKAGRIKLLHMRNHQMPSTMIIQVALQRPKVNNFSQVLSHHRLPTIFVNQEWAVGRSP